MEKVVMELKKRSMMTYVFNKKQYYKFKMFFIRQGIKHMNWSVTKSTEEFNAISKAFKIIIK